MVQRFHSEESKIKMSESSKGKKFTEEHKRKIGETRKNKRSNNWKGGEKKSSSGYILIYKPNHPHAGIFGYIRQHRLVIENHLGRNLLPIEVVHHINSDVSDNRIENLRLFKNQNEHTRYHELLKKLHCENRGLKNRTSML